MVLGALDPNDSGNPLNPKLKAIDELLHALYGDNPSEKLGRKTPSLRKWLEGIRRHFPPEVVGVLQRDAFERMGLREMLLEPELLEKLEPSVSLVADVLLLREAMPEKTKSTARKLVEMIVQEIERKIRYPLVAAVQKGKTSLSMPIEPGAGRIDWDRTIRNNLKHYQTALGTLIPEKWFGYRKGLRFPEVCIVVDKSESMVESALYAVVIGSVLASLRSLRTHLIFFDTEIVDVGQDQEDPVEVLFNIPFGGGTDIASALAYLREQLHDPSGSLVFLISDLYEGGDEGRMLDLVRELRARGVRMFCLLSLHDSGKPDYHPGMAGALEAEGVPCFPCSPDQFANLLTAELARR